jgi:hypothetical protein
MQLAQVKSQGDMAIANKSEDRRDERAKIQGTLQSQLIDQRNNNSLPQNFESAGFDGMGGFGLEQFEPK